MRLRRVWRSVRTLTTLARAAIAVAALCVVVAGARADDLDERAQDAIDALRAGDVANAVEILDEASTAEALPTRPALVHVLCDRAYRGDDVLARASVADRRRLSAALLALAEKAHAASSDDPRAQWALSHALVVRERTGPPTGAAAWLRAADLLEDAAGSSPGEGEALGYAVTFLLEGAALEPDDQHTLLKRAAALSKAAHRAHPDSVTLATTLGSAHIWGARTLLDVNRKASKAALQMAFKQLEPHLDRALPRADVAALWNEAVTLDDQAGFALRVKYVTAPADALAGAVAFDVPITPRWTVTRVPKTEETVAYVYVTQADAAGTPLRQILFRSYTWGYSYPFTGPNQVKGDNVKNLARGLQDVAVERVFAPGTKGGPVRKTRIGRDFVGHAFEVRGEAAGDARASLALHGSCVRGGHQASFGFLVYVYGADGEIDCETQAVLDSLREPED